MPSLLSRRIVPCVLRLRLARWRVDRPVLPAKSSSPSLSERLCLRFPALVRSDGATVVGAGGCSEAVLVGSGLDWWAEDVGEVEAWEFGRDGSAGAIGGVVIVSFARTSVCLHVPAAR